MKSILVHPAKLIALAVFLGAVENVLALGETQFVETRPSQGSLQICAGASVAAIGVSSNDWAGVVRAAHDLSADINRVTGKSPAIFTASAASSNVILIGTVGKSEIIDRLVREKKIDVSSIAGKWESFFLQVVPHPFPGVENALVICGSDKRGTIYGIYDLSEQIGVSPWYYWADVPAQHHAALFVKAGKYEQGPPSVKYRGIFLNDEAPDLSNWIQEKYGRAPGFSGAANYGCGFYTNLFELMLRIRANYLWPAMWNNAFNEDDTNDPALADEYGIVMGTSHQEPMMRAQKEWDRGLGRQYGSWNFARNPEVVSNFWREGITRNKNYENLITIGLRGANDTPMASGGPEANRTLLEKIVDVQRQTIFRRNQSGRDPGAAGLVPLQGSDGLLQRRHARARRRDAVMGRGQLGRCPPAANCRGAQTQRRRGHLLSFRLPRRAAQLPVDQHQTRFRKFGIKCRSRNNTARTGFGSSTSAISRATNFRWNFS